MRFRFVGREFKMKGVEEREDPPLESKKLMFRMVVVVRGKRRRRGLEEVKLMFVDVKKAHLYARCEEEERVQLREELCEYGKYARLERWLYGMRKAAAGWRMSTPESWRVWISQSKGAHGVLQRKNGSTARGAR